ncbi:MAG TPA: ABC transporter permease subunit [Oligoflexia bacterium]|nr:ABC transporter permease subunit [Oligoflexia bacterium]
MTKIISIALNTFREAIRNKILYTAVFFALLLIAVSAFYGTVSIGDQVRVIKNFGLFSLSFFGAVITIMTGVSLLAKELREKTIFNILSKPVARWQFVLGKYCGIVLTVNMLVTLMSLALSCFLWFFEQRIDWLLFQAVFLVFLEICIISAVTVFFSSLVVTVTLTGLFTLATYIAGHSISYLGHFLKEGESSSALVHHSVRAFDFILPDLSLFNVADAVVYATPVHTAYALHAVIYCAGYCAAALALSVLIFSRRELT